MQVEDSGQPLCTCMAGGKHAETEQKLRSFVQPGMCHVQGFMGGEDGGLLQVVLTLFIPFFLLQSKLQKHGRHGRLPSCLLLCLF